MEQLEIIAAEGNSGARILRLQGSLTLRTISNFQTIARQQGDSPLIIDLSGVVVRNNSVGAKFLFSRRYS